MSDIDYKPVWWATNKHLNTIIPNKIRLFEDFQWVREKIETPDNDFLHLDWSAITQIPTDTIVVLVHGLEGSSKSGYIRGMAKQVNSIGLDAVALNLRSCSGEMNQQLNMYHSGKIDDLETALKHVNSKGYKQVILIGFSLGGNLVLLYTGKKGSTSPIPLIKTIAISTPCDLNGSTTMLEKKSNTVYRLNFLMRLKNKAKKKQVQFPNADLNWEAIFNAKTISEFDDHFTARIHGFKDSKDYYTQCSSLNVVDKISTSTWIINAQDDSFLSESCTPKNVDNKHLQIIHPKKGGHVGFIDQLPLHKSQWHERLAAQIIENET